MGPSWALISSAAFALVLLSSADLRKPVVPHQVQQVMQERQDPDSFMLQKEVDLAELFDLDAFSIEQRIVDPPEIFSDSWDSRPRVVAPRGRKPFAPRSFGGPPALNYPVEFPLSRPTHDNLEAICLYGENRPTYPTSYFPSSGYGQLKRRAKFVNKAESWFTSCCSRNQTWGSEGTLCCATQGWELSVESFCEEDSSVKDRLYDCCKMAADSSDRLNCFNNDAPNPNYTATVELPMPPLPSTDAFTFDLQTCQRKVMTPSSVRGSKKNKKAKKPSASAKVDINFPLGRPTADVMTSLCSNQNQRPIYTVKCLPGSGFKMLARQAKTINRIEKGFKHCCKKNQGALKCADGKWRDELTKFCSGKGGERVDYNCCSSDDPNDQFSCFQNIAADPHYNMTAAPEEVPTVSKVCHFHKIIQKKFKVGFPLKSFVTQCCLLSEQEMPSCFRQRLQDLSQNLCSSKKATPSIHHCCQAHEPSMCLSKMLMDAVNKASKVKRPKKKKRCPLS